MRKKLSYRLLIIHVPVRKNSATIKEETQVVHIRNLAYHKGIIQRKFYYKNEMADWQV